MFNSNPKNPLAHFVTLDKGQSKIWEQYKIRQIKKKNPVVNINEGISGNIRVSNIKITTAWMLPAPLYNALQLCSNAKKFANLGTYTHFYFK